MRFNFLLLAAILPSAWSCTDIFMNFTNFKLSARTMDLSTFHNWTLTTWPKSLKPLSIVPLANWPAKYGSLSMTASWFGDDTYGFPTFFGDAINEEGLSCSLLALVGTKYEERSTSKTNVFAGVLCHYVVQTYATVLEVQKALESIAVWGPAEIAQHFIMRDSTGASLILEFIDGQKFVYLDTNDAQSGYGVTTNEPVFSWHLENIAHYEWKRSLLRQSIAIPGNFYPEERFLRVHMVKKGLQDAGLMESTSFQDAFSYTVQVMNTVSVPQGNQYGTDSSDSSGEGEQDHSVFCIVRDHANPTLYWRDAGNPTFRRVHLAQLKLHIGAPSYSMKMETGPFFIDMTTSLR